MSKVQQFFIKSNGSDTAIALLEDGVVRELRIEHKSNPSLVGNVYRGKVRRVLPDMQAAFVDIGLDRPGFLHRRHLPGNISDISRSLHEGQSVLVQVMKDPHGDDQHQKGAALTAEVSLPGETLIWLPLSGSGEIVFSNKLKRNLTERDVESVTTHLQRSTFAGTLIVRSSYAGDVSRLDDEFVWLQARWQRAMDNKLKAPALLLEELSLTERMLRDHPRIDIVWANAESRDALMDAHGLGRDCVGDRSKIASDKSSQEYEGLLKAAEQQRNSRIVTLANGGELVFDVTEALWVVDVNTAAATASVDAHHQTNLLAAVEIARQLRLRDIGGIVIVDFIDVSQAQRAELLAVLGEELRQDSVRTAYSASSNLGLVEISRQRKHQHQEPDVERCSVCGGAGLVSQALH